MHNSDLEGRIVASSDAFRRIDKYLVDQLLISRARIQRSIREGLIRLNGERTRPNHVVNPGDTIDYVVSSFETPSLSAEDMPLSVLYEDEYLAVINKPAGMVVHPAPGSPNGTLVNALLYRYKDMSFPSHDLRPGIVHRLDKDTSGLLIIARNEESRSRLSTAIMRREIRRTYLALAFGHLRKSEGTIDAPIGRHPTDRKRMATFSKAPRDAQTAYRVLESFDVCELLEVKLMTGRTHQIRVHLDSVGHPIVGDSLYHGGRGREKGLSGSNRAKAGRILSMIRRQALHAHKLQFVHPFTGVPEEIVADPPDDFRDLLDFLRADHLRGQK